MKIVFPVFDRITQLDFTGPAQFLSRIPEAEVIVISRDGKAVSTDSGFSILPHGSMADCPQADLICVPGGHGVVDALSDREMIGFIARQGKNARWVTSVCTGAFLLGAAGLLRGKKATTHWGYTHLLAHYGAEYVENRIVRDGNLMSAGGVTSGIDFALSLIAEIHDEDMARSIQLACEYDPDPPFEGGHPSRSPEKIVRNLRAKVYDAAAARMENAVLANPAPQ